MERVLNAVEGKLYIRNDLLSIIEDVEFFFKYPWGKYSYNRLLGSCKKDMQRQRQLYEKKKMDKGKVQKESKYTFYGFAPALQYWAYETVHQLAEEFAGRNRYETSRMLSSTVKKSRDATRETIAKIFAKSTVSN